METITEYQSYEKNLKKTHTLTLRSHLSLSNQKYKYKKSYLRLDSFQKNNDTCEMTGISRINSINPTPSTPLSTSPNSKKPKGRVSFAPRFRLINYVYYDPRETIHKSEENKIEEKKSEDEEKIYSRPKNESDDKVNIQCQCTCFLM